MSIKPIKKNQESELLQEQIIRLQKQLESFKHSNDHFLKNKLFLHYDIKEPEKVVVECETKLPVLTEVDEKKILKGKESDPTHLIIEGDNYHALSVLNYTHAGKIDLIYIDPPYNTRNKDFIYNDHFVDSKDSFRHSKWLSFMEYRLRLAKNLLGEKGIILISIDDNEQAHLRLLCDKIFGSNNWLETFVWNTEGNIDNQKKIKSNHEYILVYAKSEQAFSAPTVIDPNIGQESKLYKDTIENSIIKNGSKNPISIITLPVGFPSTIESGEISKREKGFPKIHDNIKISNFKTTNKVELESGWSSKDLLLDFIANDFRPIIDGKGQNTWFKITNTGAIYVYKSRLTDQSHVLSVLTNFGTTKRASEELKRMGVSFDYPKPVGLLKYLVQMQNNKSAIVLDFFAGSGTTGHAVLELNRDGGSRKFILCSTNDEKEPIVDKVLYPRIKKVIDGYGKNAPIPANLRYFQTDFVEKKGSVSQLKIDLTRQCAEMLCVKENVFEVVKSKKSAKNYKIFKNGNKYLSVFFDFFTDTEFTDFIAELNKLPQEAEKVVYIFVLDGSASIFAEEFAGVANCEIKEIPQKILDIYKQLAREVARK